MAGCGLDNLLSVRTPGVVSSTTLQNPASANLLVSSAQTDFACALGMYVVAGGAVSGELAWGDLNTFDYDRRTFTAATPGAAYAVNTCTGNGTLATPGVYTPLSTARAEAEQAQETISGFTTGQVPNREDLLATAAAFEGYGILLLGEAMCGASIDVGPELTRPQLWQRAESTFTVAINEAQAAGDSAILNLALLGRARTRINLSTTNHAEAAAAAADAALIPVGYVYNAAYSGADTRSTNEIDYWVNNQGRAAVDTEYWHLTFGGVPDPRVALDSTGQATLNGIDPLVTAIKYSATTSPIAMAKWSEAQLIVAEVKGGQAAVNIINALHSNAGLPPFASTDPTAIHDQVIQERERELFLEGQHLNDKIRFGLPFLPATGTAYWAGLTYGTMTCFPYPDAESQNNPNAGG
jgi:hypothetical protein